MNFPIINPKADDSMVRMVKDLQMIHALAEYSFIPIDYFGILKEYNVNDLSEIENKYIRQIIAGRIIASVLEIKDKIYVFDSFLDRFKKLNTNENQKKINEFFEAIN